MGLRPNPLEARCEAIPNPDVISFGLSAHTKTLLRETSFVPIIDAQKR